MTEPRRPGRQNGERHVDTPEARPETPIDRARHVASDATRRTVAGIESNPLGILVGGLAVGVLAGSLIPRSDKEKELLAPVGKRLGEGARAAVQAAKDAGRAELETRGLTADAGRDQVKSLLGGVAKAVSTAGIAAARAAATRTDA